MSKPKSAPYVAIKTDVRKDERFEVLGQIAGYNKYEAFGRISMLWMWCRDRKLEDAPSDSDGYVVSDAVVVRFLGENGVRAILGADVDDLALGRRHSPGMIYLRGTSETVGALRQRLAAASAGGIARSASPRVSGRYPSTSRDGAENQPTGWSQPAEAVPNSSLIRPPTSDHQEKKEDLSGKPDPAVLLAQAAVAEINRLAGSRYRADSEAIRKDCRALAKAKRTLEQVLRVVQLKRPWLDDAKMREHFKPSVLLRPSNFAKYLDELDAAPLFAQGTHTMRIPSADDDEPDLTYAGFGIGAAP